MTRAIVAGKRYKSFKELRGPSAEETKAAPQETVRHIDRSYLQQALKEL
jgi:hypothetical protein